MTARIRPIGAMAAAVVALTLAIVAMPSAAPAAEPVQTQINAQLAAYPGGTQINATEISYGGGVFVITFAPADYSVDGADCPSGWFCFYDQVNYGYPRGKLSSCGWQDLATWGWNDRTESAYYNMATGSVSFINHGALPDHSFDDVIFSLSTTKRGISDVYPYRNTADHVYRYC